MSLIQDISKGHVDAISEAIVYAFAQQAVFDALDRAVSATGAHDWYGDTGCFPAAREEFDKHWGPMRQANCELSTTAAVCILNGVLIGAHREMGRLGKRFAPAVLRHAKAEMEETLAVHQGMITDYTVCGDIWRAVQIMVAHHLDRTIPDDVAEEWDRQLDHQ